MTPDERDIVDRLRYSDQDLDLGLVAKVKLTCWEAHLELERLRIALAAAEAKVEKAMEAMERIGSAKDNPKCFCGACVVARTARKALKELTDDT